MPAPGSCVATCARSPRVSLRLALTLVLALVGWGCMPTNEGVDQTGTGAESASFTASATAGVPGAVIQFTDTSTGQITSYAWDFGAAGTSTEQNPNITFANEGTYTVTLTVTGPGGSSTTTQTDLIVIAPPPAPTADFTQNTTGGSPGLVVQFMDTSVGTVDTYAWDFGNGQGSTDPNPQVTYAVAGAYTVSLTVTGPTGTGTTTRTDLIRVIQAGATCGREVSFIGQTVTCTDTSVGAESYFWDFGDGTTSTEQNPTHVYLLPNMYSIEQTVRAGTASDSTTSNVEVLSLGLTVTPSTGAAPLDTMLMADTGGLNGTFRWTIDNVLIPGSGATTLHTFNQTGTFTVRFTFLNAIVGAIAQLETQVTTTYGPAVAGFSPSTSGGGGPLSVVFMDESEGEITQWTWDFGDGTGCIFPTPPPPFAACDAQSPSHVYDTRGSYDVSLEVTGPGENPGDPNVTSQVTLTDAVRVYIEDASFELQTSGQPIGGAWTPLPAADPDTPPFHVALSRGSGADPDIPGEPFMPTDNDKWARLDGLGTDGSTPVVDIQNGIQQVFIYSPDEPVIEFDYALLYNEAPSSPTLDAVTATISDGVTTVEMTSAQANVSSPFVGASARSQRAGEPEMLITAVRTASLNLATAFPTAPDLTEFTLTIRVSNAVNAERSPYAYVDDIRFTTAPVSITSAFVLDNPSLAVGELALFMDDSCADTGDGACTPATSWRWDFDTQFLPLSPAALGASGSGAQDPSYAFPEAGDYDVRLLARRGDVEDESSLLVTVIDAPMANFAIVTPPPYTAQVDIQVNDLSTADASDPITTWDWDFGTWGQRTGQDPGLVQVGAGDTTIRLDITTASGRTSSFEIMITVDSPT